MLYEIGMHRVRHGCLMQGIDDLMQGAQADLIYTDPPWGQGLLSYWQTLNAKDTGAPKQVMEHSAFVKQIFSVCSKHGKGLLFVEYGQQWRVGIILAALSAGFKHIETIECLYDSGRPLDLHVFSKTLMELPNGYVKSVFHSSGLNTVKNAIAPFVVPGGIILDPMCGMGYTAKAGVPAGMIFRGNELNLKRLSLTMKYLEGK